MSLQRLSLFLRDNLHDIIDYWVHNKIIHYVRVISRQSGIIYMVKVESYELQMDSFKAFEKNNSFYLEEELNEENIPELLLQCYDHFCTVFPEYRHQFLLQYSDICMQSRDKFYRVLNTPCNKIFQYHFLVDIEWFYENIFTAHHEMDKKIETIFYKIEKKYHVFFSDFHEIIKTKEISSHDFLSQGWNSMKKIMEITSKCKIYLSEICSFEDNCQRSYQQLLSMNHPDHRHLGFQETMKRSFEKKQVQEKLEEAGVLKRKLIEKTLFLSNQHTNLLFQFFLFILNVSKLLTHLQSSILEFSSQTKLSSF